jgi:hypothetical protein
VVRDLLAQIGIPTVLVPHGAQPFARPVLLFHHPVWIVRRSGTATGEGSPISRAGHCPPRWGGPGCAGTVAERPYLVTRAQAAQMGYLDFVDLLLEEEVGPRTRRLLRQQSTACSLATPSGC